ncbi:MAG: protease inhibitor I42 family protein [bacterium]
MDLDSGDDGTTITVDVGDTISIVLESNVTTGYQWVLDTGELNTDVVSKKSNQYFPGNATGYIVGAGGFEQWIFEAEDDGTTTIKLDYKRTWETTVQDTFEVTVTVE